MITLDVAAGVEQAVRDSLAELRRALTRATMAATQDVLDLAVRTSRRNYLSGGPGRLTTRTGHLGDCFVTAVEDRGDRIAGRLDNTASYARTHELGAVIHARRADFLKFKIPGVGWRQAREVTIPSRPFMRPALEEAGPAFDELLRRRVIQELT